MAAGRIGAVPSPSPSDGHTFSRARDARVCWLLAQHPVTAAMLASLGWFPSAAKARRRLRVLARRKRVRLIGTVARRAGRPEHVWCGWTPKVDQLLHEVELTDLCLRLDAGEVRRGPHVRDKGLRADAELWINGQLYSLELDRATSGYDRVVSRRFVLYRSRPQLSLWVCPTPARRDGLRLRAKDLRATALFATLADALASPHGPVWLDHGGQRAALPRHTHRVVRNVGFIPGPKRGP
jgi:hypothetical protein